MPYHVKGNMVEICTCKIMCPCWLGEDPDGGTCDGVLAWQIDEGAVEGVDVSGVNLVILAHLPGNALQGNWRAVLYMDDGASAQQEEAVLNVFSGKLGGPIADLAQLIGEVAAVHRAPIAFAAEGVNGSLRVGQAIEADMVPFTGASGNPTVIQDTVFLPSPPGTPAYIGKAPTYRVNVPEHGFSIDLQGHNAVQTRFDFTG